ncbi:transposable element Tcb1 transposase [Trichonephila clavipes]|nr:transposable element Tcb1 transposase [Trichonephila clavipes]
MDRRGRSHSPQSTTSRDDKQIVCMAVTELSVTSRTVSQHIESVKHHSVSARTFRRRLRQSDPSARRPLLGLPLTQNHGRLRRQWCDERRMWAAEWNEVVFTDVTHLSATPRWLDSSLETPWREDAEQLRYAPPHWSCTRYYGMGRIGYHSRTPLVRIAATLNSCTTSLRCWRQLPFLTFRAWPQPYFNKIMRDRTWHALSKVSSSITRLNCFPGWLALRIFRR